MLLIADVKLLLSQHLAESVMRQFPELLCERHVTEMRVQVLCGSVVHMVQAVTEGKKTNADTILCCDAAFEELATQQLELGHDEQVRCLYHVLDGAFA